MNKDKNKLTCNIFKVWITTKGKGPLQILKEEIQASLVENNVFQANENISSFPSIFLNFVFQVREHLIAIEGKEQR
ncbi:hypothetical protein RJT34_14555 [Clitoria ternatea]|uniref:Uncharacterized protein n=1 Tax=Clitoria ternatea TaxID=43366 RepID=A0AAN9JST8_CLITE